MVVRTINCQKTLLIHMGFLIWGVPIWGFIWGFRMGFRMGLGMGFRMWFPYGVSCDFTSGFVYVFYSIFVYPRM